MAIYSQYLKDYYQVVIRSSDIFCNSGTHVLLLSGIEVIWQPTFAVALFCRPLARLIAAAYLIKEQVYLKFLSCNSFSQMQR